MKKKRPERVKPNGSGSPSKTGLCEIFFWSIYTAVWNAMSTSSILIALPIIYYNKDIFSRPLHWPSGWDFSLTSLNFRILEASGDQVARRRRQKCRRRRRLATFCSRPCGEMPIVDQATCRRGQFSCWLSLAFLNLRTYVQVYSKNIVVFELVPSLLISDNWPPPL